MKIIFFTYFYPPDLSAASFRAVALVQALSKKLKSNDELHIITTHPNRYASYKVAANNIELDGRVTIHRITVPKHQSGMLSQLRAMLVYAISAHRLSKKINPSFIIGTSGRLISGMLTGFSAHKIGCRYFIDLRDIFSESISDLFSRKNKIIGGVFKTVFSFLERKFLKNAAGVNVISEALPDYFQKQGIDTSNWSFFPNGIDDEFLNFPSPIKKLSKSVKTILYAGNIGSGQGLELVIPSIAKHLGLGYRFVIIGDGSTNSLLKTTIQRNNISNVELLSPVSRPELIKYYMAADIMFLHLNNFPAFRRALPSKIFEYAALKKPIVAGLSGYPAQFMRDHIPYAFLFDPCDSKGAVSCVLNAVEFSVPEDAVSEFVMTYSRVVIMDQMANQLISIMESSR